MKYSPDIDELEDDDFWRGPGGRGRRGKAEVRDRDLSRKRPKDVRLRPRHVKLDDTLQHQDLSHMGATSGFAPTFSSSRHEREWILNYLGAFYDEQKILDVLRKVKGGKEANVYCCQAHPNLGMKLVAAKIYRPRMFRNLRNDALYRQGRTILDENGKLIQDRRALHAIAKKTDIGKEFSHISWLQHEFVSMQVLFDAGLNVPEPLVSGNNTILMEYIGEVDAPAPALNEIDLPRPEAREIFERLLWNVEQMLANRRIHGDLSAYNVLYWEGQIKIIDFPQAIDPQNHPKAFPIFQRDLQRLCQYFSRYGIESDADALARAMWGEMIDTGSDDLPDEME